jgi:hypothetical protein
MNLVTTLYRWVDAFLIFFFRIGDVPILGYYLGCAVVGLICVILGQVTIAAAFRWNRRFIDGDNHQMIHMHNLSMKALMAKDKAAYKSCNKEANEAFGKVFFSQIALAVSGLWPLPFAVGWMQNRFLNVEFPLPVTLPWIGDHVGFMFTFLPIYILVYICFGKIKRKLPFFRTMAKILDEYDQNEGAEQMIRVSDLISKSVSNRTTPSL